MLNDIKNILFIAQAASILDKKDTKFIMRNDGKIFDRVFKYLFF